MSAERHAYLYVISSDDFDPLGSCVKIGRSVNPPQRRSQLQTGNKGKLVVRGQWCVAAKTASRLETAVKAVLHPLRVKGEVFRASDQLACAVVAWIAEHEQPDPFVTLAVEHEVATLEWAKIDSRPTAHGRWRTDETVSAAKSAWTKLQAINGEMFALDPQRAAAVDPFSAPTCEAKRQEARRGCV